jgi:hypothetical protein|tara:strand:+ start:281 stop:571 length:291 start_codon:yes stop_codon:yes gene_type:complete
MSKPSILELELNECRYFIEGYLDKILKLEKKISLQSSKIKNLKTKISIQEEFICKIKNSLIIPQSSNNKNVPILINTVIQRSDKGLQVLLNNKDLK